MSNPNRNHEDEHHQQNDYPSPGLSQQEQPTTQLISLLETDVLSLEGILTNICTPRSSVLSDHTNTATTTSPNNNVNETNRRPSWGIGSVTRESISQFLGSLRDRADRHLRSSTGSTIADDTGLRQLSVRIDMAQLSLEQRIPLDLLVDSNNGINHSSRMGEHTPTGTATSDLRSRIRVGANGVECSIDRSTSTTTPVSSSRSLERLRMRSFHRQSSRILSSSSSTTIPNDASVESLSVSGPRRTVTSATTFSSSSTTTTTTFSSSMGNGVRPLYSSTTTMMSQEERVGESVTRTMRHSSSSTYFRSAPSSSSPSFGGGEREEEMEEEEVKQDNGEECGGGNSLRTSLLVASRTRSFLGSSGSFQMYRPMHLETTASVTDENNGDHTDASQMDVEMEAKEDIEEKDEIEDPVLIAIPGFGNEFKRSISGSIIYPVVYAEKTETEKQPTSTTTIEPITPTVTTEAVITTPTTPTTEPITTTTPYRFPDLSLEEKAVSLSYDKPLLYSWGTSPTSGLRSLHANAYPPPSDVPSSLVVPSPNNRLTRDRSFPIVSVATSSTHSACADSNGNVICTGTNVSGCIDPTASVYENCDDNINDHDGNQPFSKPTRIESLLYTFSNTRRILQISCGRDHTAASTDEGSVFTWGGNAFGQLGHLGTVVPPTGTTSGRELLFRTPKVFDLPKDRRGVSVACGDGITVVLTTRSGVYVAGKEQVMGSGGSLLSVSPSSTVGKRATRTLPVLDGLPVCSIAVGDRHVVVCTVHGGAYTWGENGYGQCGREYPTSLAGNPVPIGGMKTEKGRMIMGCGAGGKNALENLGYGEGEKGEREGIGLPSDVYVVHAACGKDHTILVLKDGSLLVCGRFNFIDSGKSSGGDGGTGSDNQHEGKITSVRRVRHPNSYLSLSSKVMDDKKTPVDSKGTGTSFTSAEAGDGHTLLLDDAGDLYSMTCGYNSDNDDDDDGSRMQEDSEPTNVVDRKRRLFELVPRPILIGRKVLTIATGGKECIAVATSPSLTAAGGVGSGSVPRQFSIDDAYGYRYRHRCRNGDERAATSFEDLLELLGKEDESEDKNNGGIGRSREDIAQELTNRIKELLKYPSVLNGFFLDPAELYRMYQKLLSAVNAKENKDDGGSLTISNDVRRIIAKAVYDGMAMGLEWIQTHGAKLIYPEAVRCLLLYVHFFDWIDIVEQNDKSSSYSFVLDRKGTCIQSLCETILNLNFEGYKSLSTWAISTYDSHYNDDRSSDGGDKTFFVRMLVRPLLRQLDGMLEITIDDDQVEHLSPSRPGVPLIVNVLRWLYSVSSADMDVFDYCSAGGVGYQPLARPEDFYCTGLDSLSTEQLYKDYASYREAHKNNTGFHHFYITAHPFLLPPTRKRNLLHLSNEIEMYRIGMQDASFDFASNQLSIEPYFVLEVDRDNLFIETLEKLSAVRSPKVLRKKLKVIFRGEEGVDAGGLTKEFFQLLSMDLFDVNSSLWTGRYGEAVTWFNADCTWDDGGYEMVGLLVGLALYNGVMLDVNFPPTFYRKLLGLTLGLEDMIDQDMKRSLGQLLDYEGDDVEDVFCLNFEVTWMNLGKEEHVDLITGGSDIPVTNENREEYVRLYVKWLLVDSIAHQWDMFKKGIEAIMESFTLSMFRPEELELLLVGTPDLDWSALADNVKYEGGYGENSEVVKFFWKYTRSIPRESQIKLLKFVTGCGKAPIGGLGTLSFTIQRAGPDSNKLPTSHTCFNILMLPEYSTFEKLEQNLGRAIVECEGFGLE